LRWIKGIGPLIAALAVLAASPADAKSTERWIGSWGASPTDLAGAVANPAAFPIYDATIRTHVRLSAGGSAVRLRLSNELGSIPLRLGSVRVALFRDGKIVPGSDRPVTFGGTGTAMIAAGAALVSDAVALPVEGLAELAISIYVPGPVPHVTAHGFGHNWTWMSARNETGKPELTAPLPSAIRYIVSGVEVATASPRAGTIVVLGDSITDGAASTFNTNRRWPDILAERLQAAGMTDIGIVNEGIGGNRLLSSGAGISASGRLDRDVFSQPNVRALILFVGINDLGMPVSAKQQVPSPSDMISAYTQIAQRVRAKGIRLFAVTLLPYGKAGPNYHSAEGDRIREDVNAWMRTTPLFDGVIDLDRLAADPEKPSQLAPLFDSGDGVHPSDAGYAAIARAIDLNLLK